MKLIVGNPFFKLQTHFLGRYGDSLNLMGWCPWWERTRDEKNYDFWVSNFGNEHRLNYNFVSGEVELKTRYKGLANIFHALHFVGGPVPNGSIILNSWQYYQNLTVFYILLAAIIGIILFLKRKRERKIGLSILISSFLFSILFMIYIWLVG